MRGKLDGTRHDHQYHINTAAGDLAGPGPAAFGDGGLAQPVVSGRGRGVAVSAGGRRAAVGAGRAVGALDNAGGGPFEDLGAAEGAEDLAGIGERLAQSLRASPLLLTAAVLALAGWLIAKGLPAFARTGEIFALAVGAGFVLIVLFGVFGVAWDRVILWDWAALEEVPGGALSAAGTLAAGGYALLLLGQVRPEGKQKQVLRRKLGVLFGSLAVGMLLVVGRLGAGLTGQIDRPFFQMVSGLGFEGAFQRLEELASALWVLGDVALLGFLLLCMRRLLAALAGREESSGLGWIVTGGSFLLALPLAHGRGIEILSVVPVGNLIAMGVMSLGLGWKMAFSKKSEKT